MNQMTATAFPPASAQASALEQQDRIAHWLREYIADVLSVPPERIDPSLSFNQLGLESSAAVGMSGDLGDWLGRELDVALVYDHPSIQALARVLSPEH